MLGSWRWVSDWVVPLIRWCDERRPEKLKINCQHLSGRETWVFRHDVRHMRRMKMSRAGLFVVAVLFLWREVTFTPFA